MAIEDNKNFRKEKQKYDPESDPTIEEVLKEEFGKDNFILDDNLLKSRNDSDDEFEFTDEKALEQSYLYSWEKKKLDAFKNEYEDANDLDVFLKILKNKRS